MPKLNVLFLCTGNSCRSVMGETLLRHLAGDHFNVCSAGTDPKGINPIAVQVLEEIGVSTEGVRSKHLAEFLESKVPFDYVITVCDSANVTCPSWPGQTTRLHWPFDDPPAFQGSEQQRLEKFRAVRDEIRHRIQQWIAGQ